jgi:hypothetical protein
VTVIVIAIVTGTMTGSSELGERTGKEDERY